jgi:hypothetical protein
MAGGVLAASATIRAAYFDRARKRQQRGLHRRFSPRPDRANYSANCSWEAGARAPSG